MTEEEKKAIKILGTFEFRQKTKYYNKIDLEDVGATNIVLNLITNLQKENETTCKLNANMSKRHLNDTFKIKNYENQIDLMINFIYEALCKYPGTISHALRKNGFNDDECGTCENTDRNCIKCLKQYFETKAKGE